MLPFVFEDGMGYERYVDYALDVPMYFVYRDGRYIDVAGASFRDFMDGKLPKLPGELPTLDDWSDHLTTLFPEVRLKRFLEMRGADGGRWRRICALPAFWVGLLYDGAALDAAWDLVKSWTDEERHNLRDGCAERRLCRRSSEIQLFRRSRARRSGSRAPVSGTGGGSTPRSQDETIYLSTLEGLVASGKTLADELMERYQGPWRGHIDHIFEEFAF